MNLHPEQIVDGKYRILRLLGEGSMGAVYLAENVRIGRRVALKVLHADLAAEGPAGARFQVEAQITARVGSAHIVEILDMGDLPGGNGYLVMEYLEGETLAARLEQRITLSADELSGFVVQALDALAKAHAAHVIHRDIKPENIYLVAQEEGDFVKLLDFGVSKLLEETQRRAPHLTMDGTVVGTPQYMSPEQARGKELDARSDLYSLGVVMYEALAGQPPFSGANVHDVLFRVALEDVPPLDGAMLEVDESFLSIVRRAMAREPDDRYPSAEAFRGDVRAWRRSRGLFGAFDSVRAGLPPAAPSMSSTAPVALSLDTVSEVRIPPPSSSGARRLSSTSTTTATAVSTRDVTLPAAASSEEASALPIEGGLLRRRRSVVRLLAASSVVGLLAVALVGVGLRSSTQRSLPTDDLVDAGPAVVTVLAAPAPVTAVVAPPSATSLASVPSERAAQPEVEVHGRGVGAPRPREASAPAAQLPTSERAAPSSSAGPSASAASAVPPAAVPPAAAAAPAVTAPPEATVAPPLAVTVRTPAPPAKTIRGRKYRSEL